MINDIFKKVYKDMGGVSDSDTTFFSSVDLDDVTNLSSLIIQGAYEQKSARQNDYPNGNPDSYKEAIDILEKELGTKDHGFAVVSIELYSEEVQIAFARVMEG